MKNQKERPILYSTPMVQAILRGDKNQTRREIKHKTKIIDVRRAAKAVGKFILTNEFGEDFIIKPKCNIGDILWCRETWQHTKVLNLHPTDADYGYVYKADGHPWNNLEGWIWKPSIFMPKAACRIFLEVTNVRVQRLEDITKEDAINEGIEKWQQQGGLRYKSYIKPTVCFGGSCCNIGAHPAICSFRTLWASINGFDNLRSNPWVFVYEFVRINK